jgi:hypothetical protein
VDVGSPGPSTSDFASIPAAQGALDAIADEIAVLGEESFTDSFAGIEVNTQEDLVDVWRRPSKEFDAAIDAKSWADRVRLHDAPHSAVELRQVAEQVAADTSYWSKRGLSVCSVGGPMHRGICVEVITDNPARANEEFKNRYPMALLRIVPGERTTLHPL